MTLTSHSVLRTRIVETLLGMNDFRGQRADVLDAMAVQYAGAWTAEDLEVRISRGRELKWRNNASFERQAMVTEGFLEEGIQGVWALTQRGQALSSSLSVRYAKLIAQETARREAMWNELQTRLSNDGMVSADDTREVGMYSGARGVYADKDVTRTEFAPSGILVSMRHTGKHYDDEMTNDGMIYHFPNTKQPGHDESDISSLIMASKLGLPVFLISSPIESPRRRQVYRGVIESVDLNSETALITFLHNAPLPPAMEFVDSEEPFRLTGGEATKVLRKMVVRPNQKRFAFEVIKKYPGGCVACGLTEPSVLEAAHIYPKADLGSDDSRNGILLCANHHKMFDRDLWAIDPDNLVFLFKDGLEPEVLGFKHVEIGNSIPEPAQEALRARHVKWSKSQ